VRVLDSIWISTGYFRYFCAMRRMADMPESELARIGRSGRDYYDAHFAPAMLAGRMLDLFSEAVAARHPEGEVRR
jgi:hypothetical protein